MLIWFLIIVKILEFYIKWIKKISSDAFLMIKVLYLNLLEKEMFIMFIKKKESINLNVLIVKILLLKLNRNMKF